MNISDHEFKCLACNGEGLASAATVQAQQERIDAAINAAQGEDHRWRLAAEVVFDRIEIQGEPALDFIARVVSLVERITA